MKIKYNIKNNFILEILRVNSPFSMAYHLQFIDDS